MSHRPGERRLDEAKLTTIRYSERPELWDRTAGLAAEIWPEYNLHGDVLNVYWSRLYEEFPDFQFVLYDAENDEVAAEGHTIPCYWDGSTPGLGPGIDATIAAGFARRADGAAVNTLSALAAEVVPEHRDRGLSAVILRRMTEVARSAGLRNLIAPVRPSWKERYPLTPIERYVTWSRPDGEPLDPWIRVHVRLGGRIAAPIPESMRITGTAADWETWTNLAYPESGDYVFPRGLATLHIDRAAGRGTYWEPNVWIVHGPPSD